MGPRVFVLVAILSLAAAGQDLGKGRERSEDFHLREDAARSLYSVSAFAHGHRHGYEAGYLAADVDIHYGRDQREWRPKDVPGSMNYRREFGDKSRFRQGFIYGFIAGYNDSYASRSFRLPDWTEQLPALPSASNLPQSDVPAGPDKATRRAFDDGMLRGYRAASGSQFADNEPPAVAEQASSACRSEGRSNVSGYCDGFVQGFLFGAADRGSLQPLPPASQASAGGHVP